jgi:hypothetical protein
MKWPRLEETTFFDSGTVEVRSRPIWVVIVEFWFLYVHEFFTHILWERVPERIRDRVRDDYWGDPSEAAFHTFYSWTLSHERIDKSAKYTKLDTKQKGFR